MGLRNVACLTGVDEDRMRTVAAAGLMLAALALAVALTGCSGTKPAPAAAPNLTRPCPVTSPGSSDLRFGDGGFNYGNDSLGVALWPNGKMVSGRLPDGGSYAETKPDGSIRAKLGWWRAVEGQLSIDGSRLDASAPPLRAEIPAGYGPTGFQATVLTFPTQGCWQVIGSVGNARLKFVVLVSKHLTGERR
jgi:hypothetical protein